jgi:hypothetical protein
VYFLKNTFFLIAEAVFLLPVDGRQCGIFPKAQNGNYRFGKETLPCHDTSMLFPSTASTERAGKP